MTPTTTSRVRRAPARLAAALISGAIALLATVFLAGPASAAGEHHHIEISQYMYMPMSLTIEQGETVTWTNEDTVEHDVTVTSGPASFQSPMLGKGESWSHTFTVAGPYSYICSVHPDMKATVTVTAAAPAAPVTKAPVVAPTKAVPTKAAGSPQAPKAAAADPKPAKAQAAAAVEQTTTAAPQVVSAPASSATLQPLILVVGAAVMAVVFCLLLMASRPVVADGADEAPVAPKHLDEG